MNTEKKELINWVIGLEMSMIKIGMEILSMNIENNNLFCNKSSRNGP